MAEVKNKKPTPLTEDEKARICEEYLGVHPKYFKYAGQKIRVDIWNMENDGINWRGWRIQEKEIGEWKEG